MKDERTATIDNQNDWLKSFDLGYNASSKWQEAQEFEKDLEADSPKAEAYTLGRETYERDREQESLAELRSLREDSQDKDLEMEYEC